MKTLQGFYQISKTTRPYFKLLQNPSTCLYKSSCRPINIIQDPHLSSTRTAIMSSSNRPTTSSSDSLESNVTHDKNKCEFSLTLSNNGSDKALLSYSWLTPGHMDMHHTEVPPVFRGKGVAKILAKTAFDYAVAEDAKMTLTCTYLQKYFQDNPKPEYQTRVV